MLGVGGPCGDGTGGAVAADDRVAGPLAPLRPAAISAPTRVPMVAGVPEVPAGGPPAFDGFEVVLECFGMLVGERNSVPAVEEQARARSAVRDLLRRRLPNLVFLRRSPPAPAHRGQTETDGELRVRLMKDREPETARWADSF